MSSEKPALKPKPKIPPPVKAKKPQLAATALLDSKSPVNASSAVKSNLTKTVSQTSEKSTSPQSPKPESSTSELYTATVSKFPPPPVHVLRNKAQGSVAIDKSSPAASSPEQKPTSPVSSQSPVSSDDEDAPPLPLRPSRTESVSSVEEEDAPPLPRRPTASAKSALVDEIESKLQPPRPERFQKHSSPDSEKPRPPRPGKPSLNLKPNTDSFSRNLSSDLEKLSISSSKPLLSPPNPPKSRSPAHSSGTSTPPSPPKPRTKPSAPPPRSGLRTNWKAPDLNLELSTGWFAKDDFENHLPTDLKGLDYATSFGYNSKEFFRVVVFRNKDLSTIKLRFTWPKSGDPGVSVEHEIKFVPPPQATKAQLEEGASLYGEHVAGWTEAHKGKKVGDGECWTLAHDALQRGCGKHAFVSSGLVHGALLSTITGKKGGPEVRKEPVSDTVKRGDILQFANCCFRYPNKALFYGSPDHTSIVGHVTGSTELPRLQVLHQNVNGEKIVIEESIDLDMLVEGSVKVYRPIGAGWISELSPMW
ncbi:hypothetical protein KL930_002999 [Ogataea haglerorum]|nr:hypothetical protein KL915_003709 [Ogataea haglerorum]KAG7704861.1 hypothetical protein KL950_004034 [Ogataea haglerorum]KAG7739290.1 hypothetical protein KL932_003384 [Ogataea haglerorum]KAG7756248.1 hypothetical protein KL947_003854 [Ogataea haglerorum]KAG7777325.1 hypothetical protein KL930_002999 [Ogataea haglerorum]